MIRGRHLSQTGLRGDWLGGVLAGRTDRDIATAGSLSGPGGQQNGAQQRHGNHKNHTAPPDVAERRHRVVVAACGHGSASRSRDATRETTLSQGALVSKKNLSLFSHSLAAPGRFLLHLVQHRLPRVGPQLRRVAPLADEVLALTLNSAQEFHHEGTKGRKHEKERQFLSCFRDGFLCKVPADSTVLARLAIGMIANRRSARTGRPTPWTAGL